MAAPTSKARSPGYLSYTTLLDSTPRTPAGATLSKGSLRGFTAAKRIRESASPGAASHHLKSSSLIVNVGTVSNDSGTAPSLVDTRGLC
jgi:hypothetical protein